VKENFMTMDESAVVTLLAVREDQGPFEHLGGQFSCNGAGWLGKAMVSPIAVYLFKKAKNTHQYGGGLAGALLATALAKDDALSTCTVADLPPQIRTQFDPKGKFSAKDVVIVPKTTVSLVKGGGWNNQVEIRAGTDKFKIATGLFRMFAKPRAMRRMGWTLNTPLTPTAAPVHDTRSPEERAAHQKPAWVKVLAVLGAIGLIILVIVLRILAGGR
jgi:hypothetical protein